MSDLLAIAAVGLGIVALAFPAWVRWLDRRRARRFDLHTTAALHAARPDVTWRCWTCPGSPVIHHPLTHSRLVHRQRVTGPDDDEAFLSTL